MHIQNHLKALRPGSPEYCQTPADAMNAEYGPYLDVEQIAALDQVRERRTGPYDCLLRAAQEEIPQPELPWNPDE